MKAVIFDCFGVLYLPPARLFYEANIPRYEELRDTLHDLDRQADYGLISQDDLVLQVSELSGLDKTFVQDNILGGHTRNQALLDFVQSLRPRFKIGLLSNISPGSMDRFFAPQERAKFFDVIVLSGEAGMTKPNPEIYQTTAGRLGVSAGECVMVDDSLDNCYGADAAGMRWIHFVDTPQCKNDLQKLIDER